MPRNSRQRGGALSDALMEAYTKWVKSLVKSLAVRGGACSWLREKVESLGKPATLLEGLSHAVETRDLLSLGGLQQKWYQKLSRKSGVWVVVIEGALSREGVSNVSSLVDHVVGGSLDTVTAASYLGRSSGSK